MININKEEMNKNINQAYENQTEKVKELLDSAKKNLAEQKASSYDYTANKEKAIKFHTVSRIVTKNKENENRIENNINSKFDEMSKKLEINSKNLDFIFENVAKNKKNEVTLLEDISRKQDESVNQVIKSVEKISEENLKNKQYIEDARDKMQEHISHIQTEILNQVSEKEVNLEEKVVIVEAKLAERLNQMQMQNEEMLMQMKQDIMQSYQKENKHAINTLLEERNAYLKEIEEKDKEIRQLNYKIYEYEEKLEKEIAKREKFNILASFFRKENTVEEEPNYTCQILNYVY